MDDIEKDRERISARGKREKREKGMQGERGERGAEENGGAIIDV